ncbi:MAG TPA: MFS transporter [Rariglobus sp.]
MNPAPAPTDPPVDSRIGRKVWTAGTLTYTSAGITALFCWLLLGDFVWSMRDRSAGPMAHWYLNHLEVPSVVFGLLLSSFPALVSFILMPVIGVKSDHHRGKWGRRIPFLLVTTPLAALGMLGLALSPLVAKWVHSHFPGQSEMLVSVVCFGVFWAAFELATIAGGAVFGGLINDVVPKELLGRFYGLFRAVSLVDGMIFNYWIMGKVPEHFTLIMGIVGAVYGIAFTWVCLKVKEGGYPPPPPGDPSAPGAALGFFRGARTYCRECFSKPYYLLVFAMLTAAFLSFGPINIFAIPYARSLGVNMDTYGKYLALTFLISLCLSYFIGWLVDKFHPLRMTMAALLGYAVVAFWGRFYATTPGTFLAAWVAHGVLSGCFFTSVASLGQRLYPRDKFAQYASASAMVMSPANMVLAPLVGLLLDRTGKVYHHTFTAGGSLALVALVLAFFVHYKFMRLGGPKNYLAPA